MGMQAGGLQQDNIALPPIAVAPAKIAIDGKLDEWRGITGFDYKPLAQIVKSGGDPVIDALLADPVSANIKTCYDADALYVAVDWRDRQPGTNTTAAGNEAHWFQGGEGFALHFRTDQVLHVACWPTAKGVAVWGRHGDGPWQDFSASFGAAGAPGADGKSYSQELRIPWSALTASGKPPGDGRIDLGLDFSWNALPESILPQVRSADIATEGAARGVTYSFLTSSPELITAGYISNSAGWGDLALGSNATGDQTIKLPDGGTSLAALPVPEAKAPPVIDGTLNGWDPATFQPATYLGAFWGDRYSGQLGAMYDSANLYLAFHVPQSGPTNLMAASTGAGYAGGDALQIRLSNGTKRINLCGWFDSKGNQPALTSDGKDLPNPFILSQGAQEAFKPDGKGGYIQTLSLPWRVLFDAAPGAGSPVKGTFEIWLADMTPRFSLHAHAVLEKRPVLSIAYTMPQDGQVTLGLFDPAGSLIRWVAQDVFRYKGDNQEPWNGLDQWGQPVTPGSYVVKALYHAPLTTDYKMSVDNPGNPPWSTPDDKGDWLGDESNPQAAATDGKWVFLACPDCEKGISIMAVDETGQRQWGVSVSMSPRTVSLAVNGDYVYALYSGPESTINTNVYRGKNAVTGRAILLCLDKKTGQPAKFMKDNPRLRVAAWPYREQFSWLWDLRNNQSFSAATYAGQPRYAAAEVGETTDALGVAAAGNAIYISLFYDNKIVALDGQTGKPTGDEIPIDTPVGLCTVNNHTLLAVSGTQVMEVDLKSKTCMPFITSDLVAPFAVTMDKNRHVFVSDWGASFQVKEFDPTGRFIRAIGKKGGRPWSGKWDANGMLVPHGIAVTDEGKLWVAEDDSSPKRVSVWDINTGAFLKDYIGPTGYGGGTYFWADPKDPTQIYTAATRFKVDLDKKTYVPEATVFRHQSHDDPFMPNGNAWGNAAALYHDGHEYALVNTASDMFTVLQRQGDVFKAVAAFGSAHRDRNPAMNIDGTEMDVWDSDIGHHAYPGYFPDAFKGHPGDNYSWTDANGDNLVQSEELHWVKTVDAPYQEGTQPTLRASWGTAMASNWSYFTSGSFRDKEAIFRVDVQGWTDAGAPIYDMAAAKAIAFVPTGSAIDGLYVTRDNRLIVSFSYEWGHSPDSIACYDLDGNKLWSIAKPKRMEGKQVHATNAVYDFTIPGIGDVIGTWLWHGAARPYLFTTDGLYVGTLLENTLLGPTALWGESYTYYYQGADGTPYVVNGGSQACHILQIKGLEAGSVGRINGTYTLSEADAQKAADMREMPEQQAAAKPPLAATWVTTPPVIDGDLSDWNLAGAVSLDGGQGRTAQVALARDADHLYLAYKVQEKNPMRNGGNDWQTLFTTGDCVDLMLQSDPKADPNRHDAAPGDERLLFSMFQDNPVAVLYRPVVPGTTTPVRLAAASIDQIVKLGSAQVAIKRDADHGFYTVEASVPLKDLGLSPQVAGDLRGDVGVIFADESGKSRALRLYYYNPDTQMVNDLPTEARLQPANWGTLSLPAAAP